MPIHQQQSTAVALKEWESICRLLAEGRQIMLLRKGGIHEGQNRLEIAHRRFALLPTRLHQKAALLKPEFRGLISAESEEPAAFPLTHAGEITDILPIRNRATMDRLRDLHAWDEPYIDLRFNYRPERPLYLLLVRALRLAEPFELKNTWQVAGCRSWVPLPSPLEASEPVLEEAEWQAVRRQVLERLRDSSGSISKPGGAP